MGLVTAGYSLTTCSDKQSSGGLQTLWIINSSELDPSSCVFAAGTGYTTLALDSSKNAYQIDFERDSAEHREEFQERESEFGPAIWVHELELSWPRSNGQTLVEYIEELGDGCGYIFVYKNFNSSTQYVLGYNENDSDSRPMFLKSNTMATGKKLADGSRETVIFTNEATRKSQVTTQNMSSLV